VFETVHVVEAESVLEFDVVHEIVCLEGVVADVELHQPVEQEDRVLACGDREDGFVHTQHHAQLQLRRARGQNNFDEVDSLHVAGLELQVGNDGLQDGRERGCVSVGEQTDHDVAHDDVRLERGEVVHQLLHLDPHVQPRVLQLVAELELECLLQDPIGVVVLPQLGEDLGVVVELLDQLEHPQALVLHLDELLQYTVAQFAEYDQFEVFFENALEFSVQVEVREERHQVEALV